MEWTPQPPLFAFEIFLPSHLPSFFSFFLYFLVIFSFDPLQRAGMMSFWTLLNHFCQREITQRTHKNICWEQILMFYQWFSLSKTDITPVWLHVILEDAHQPCINSASGDGWKLAVVNSECFLGLKLISNLFCSLEGFGLQFWFRDTCRGNQKGKCLLEKEKSIHQSNNNRILRFS